MNPNRKGQARGLILVILGIVGMYAVLFYLNVAFSGIRVGVREFQEDIFTVHNALRPAKFYCKTALHYSVYQACYDNLKRGGFETVPDENRLEVGGKIYPLWYNGTDISPSRARFIEDMENGIENKLGLYTNGKTYSFLGSYSVELPAYEVAIDKGEITEDYIFLNATSNGNLTIEKTTEYTEIKLMLSPAINEKINTSCLGLFEKAKGMAGDISSMIQEKLKDKVDELIQSGSPSVACNQESILNSAMDAINSSIKSSASGYTIEVINITLNLELETPQSKVGSVFPCTFESKGESAVTATVTVQDDPGKIYPVYNGNEVAFEPLSAVFYLRVPYSP